MKKILFLLVLMASPGFAAKKYNFQDPKLNDELDNNYKEHTFPHWIYATGSSATITYLKVSTMSLDVPLPLPSLTNGRFWVGNVSNVATGVGPSGDANFTTTGVFNVLKVQGSSTNDAAAAGYVGETVSGFTGATNFAASGVFANLTSISLTAGDWDVTGRGYINHAGATLTSNDLVALSANSGNTTTDHVGGDNQITLNAPGGAAFIIGPFAIPNWRVSLSGTTTIYLKGQASYTGSAPVGTCKIYARRMR